MANLLCSLLKIVYLYQRIIQKSKLSGLKTYCWHIRMVQRTIIGTNSAVNIFNPVQVKIVVDHTAGAHAVSPPTHTIYAYKIGKAVTLYNSLAPKSSTFMSR